MSAKKQAEDRNNILFVRSCIAGANRIRTAKKANAESAHIAKMRWMIRQKKMNMPLPQLDPVQRVKMEIEDRAEDEHLPPHMRRRVNG